MATNVESLAIACIFEFLLQKDKQLASALKNKLNPTRLQLGAPSITEILDHYCRTNKNALKLKQVPGGTNPPKHISSEQKYSDCSSDESSSADKKKVAKQAQQTKPVEEVDSSSKDPLEEDEPANSQQVPAEYQCHVCKQFFTRGDSLTEHLIRSHTFQWPPGHSRFKYRKHEDGICRLQSVLYEGLVAAEEETTRSEATQTTADMSGLIYYAIYDDEGEGQGYQLRVVENDPDIEEDTNVTDVVMNEQLFDIVYNDEALMKVADVLLGEFQLGYTVLSPKKTLRMQIISVEEWVPAVGAEETDTQDDFTRNIYIKHMITANLRIGYKKKYLKKKETFVKP